MDSVFRVCFIVEGEVYRTGASYNLDTLRSVREEIKESGRIAWIEESKLRWVEMKQYSAVDFIAERC